MAGNSLIKSQQGWTILEVILVVGIVVSLAAIGIPTFTYYKGRAFDARAKNDLVAAAIAQEAYYLDWSTYSACSNSTSCNIALPSFEPSEDIQIGVVSANSNYFIITAYHPKGGGTFTWNSNNKGLQE
jgi:type II secretory pathway pseudopilin PulG